MQLSKFPRLTRLLCIATVLIGVFSCRESAPQSPDHATSESMRGEPASSGRSRLPEPRILGAEESKRAAPPQPTPTALNVAAAEPPAPTKPEELADAWLDSLGRRDLEALSSQTHLPFTVHDSECQERCPSSRANDAAELAKLVNCIGDSTLLLEDLSVGNNRSPAAQKPVDKGFPRWARRWRKEVASGLTPIGIDVFGNGLLHELIILAGSDGVHAVWRNTTYDPN